MFQMQLKYPVFWKFISMISLNFMGFFNFKISSIFKILINVTILKSWIKNNTFLEFPGVQCLAVWAFTAKGPGSIPGPGIKIPHGSAKKNKTTDFSFMTSKDWENQLISTISYWKARPTILFNWNQTFLLHCVVLSMNGRLPTKVKEENKSHYM